MCSFCLLVSMVSGRVKAPLLKNRTKVMNIIELYSSEGCELSKIMGELTKFSSE